MIRLSHSWPTARRLGALLLAGALAGCNDPVEPDDTTHVPVRLTLAGSSNVSERFTAELWIRGNLGYTTTWGTRNGISGNAIKIWNVAGATPTIVDSVIVTGASTLGDVQVTDDGAHLIVAIENGGIGVFSLADPQRPALVTRFVLTPNRGVHTAEVQRVNGTLYAFLALNPGQGQPGQLAITSLANPAAPVVVNQTISGQPYVHDVFVRDGILFAARWDGGVGIYDIGGGNRGGTPANPVLISNMLTVGGDVHNVWWYHDAAGSKKYLFVGEEGPASVLNNSAGDIHVVDVSNMAQPREVAFYTLPNAGTHNFSMDEANGVLYAAYYNAGVRAIDVRGDLSTCDAAKKSADGRCNLGLMGREIANSGADGTRPTYVWGVHFTGGKLYASDMMTGLWKFEPVVP